MKILIINTCKQKIRWSHVDWETSQCLLLRSRLAGAATVPDEAENDFSLTLLSYVGGHAATDAARQKPSQHTTQRNPNGAHKNMIIYWFLRQMILIRVPVRYRERQVPYNLWHWVNFYFILYEYTWVFLSFRYLILLYGTRSHCHWKPDNFIVINCWIKSKVSKNITSK